MMLFKDSIMVNYKYTFDIINKYIILNKIYITILLCIQTYIKIALI